MTQLPAYGPLTRIYCTGTWARLSHDKQGFECIETYKIDLLICRFRDPQDIHFSNIVFAVRMTGINGQLVKDGWKLAEVEVKRLATDKAA
jgi:hypothetical protein